MSSTDLEQLASSEMLASVSRSGSDCGVLGSDWAAEAWRTMVRLRLTFLAGEVDWPTAAVVWLAAGCTASMVRLVPVGLTLGAPTCWCWCCWCWRCCSSCCGVGRASCGIARDVGNGTADVIGVTGMSAAVASTSSSSVSTGRHAESSPASEPASSPIVGSEGKMGPDMRSWYHEQASSIRSMSSAGLEGTSGHSGATAVSTKSGAGD
mmetsp:Transcript_24594/g.69417  ORF Transcript_24594/g.69417 Transcript_24594/m.69417 type:complete len:208 (+) Transcript_24594:1043-1666(+)